MSTLDLDQSSIEFHRMIARKDVVGLELLSTAEAVQAHLADAAKRCTGEVLAVYACGFPSQSVLRGSAERDFGAVARGARMKVCWQHSMIASTRLTWYVDAARGLGAEIRGCDQSPHRFVIYDDVVFFPRDALAEDEPGAVMTRAPAAVEYFRAQHRFYWSGGRPVAAAGEGGEADEFIESDLARDIVRLLAQGEKDEVVSRKLGISLRTCRAHVARIMKVLGARSRFQAGVYAARTGLAGDSSRRR
ncbi:helix-turn-helix transcriptional regulator [Microbispora sp. H10670]|uniref:helix-turn-helix transcriptional regulator n=1 Tax=unclassified Microbispora TaxID=2614687 RepID=UPI0016013DFC|nr:MULTISPECIES: LuxR C-terminal-related transcriptional regulator [unclassified Microbispora]